MFWRGRERILGEGGWKSRVMSRGMGLVGVGGSSYGTLQTAHIVILFDISLLRYKFEFIKKRDFIKKSQYL